MNDSEEAGLAERINLTEVRNTYSSDGPPQTDLWLIIIILIYYV